MKIFQMLALGIAMTCMITPPVGAYTLTDLKIVGKTVYYKGTKTPVQIPDVYEKQKFDMRAVWVSAFAGDISVAEQSRFITQFEDLLDTMKYYNLNTMVFHVRTHNDAFYPSKLNPKSWRCKGIDFNKLDPVKYAVKRCHEEGFEFHAWLNPYRVGTTASYHGYNYSYPSGNPASDPANLLTTKDVNIKILDPGKKLVRDFLVKTCMELIKNYDIDAIHFDDYFYANGANKGRAASDKRADVDAFIKSLSTTMKAYNSANTRYVQLGISPTGVYKSVGSRAAAIGGTYDSNGTYSAAGSNNPGCQTHYGLYLCADTKKWVDNEWIDYITPQSYWSFTHPLGKFADVMEWWQMVVARKNVNLYTGMGIYRNDDSWGSNVYEAEMQTRYVTQFEHIRGTSIFQLQCLTKAKKGDTRFMRIAELKKIWNYKSLTPVIRSMPAVNLGQVSNVKIVDNKLSWKILSGAKRYSIYRTTGSTIKSTIAELIDVVGNVTNTYTDTTAVPGVSYTYAIRAISGTNAEGALTYARKDVPATSVTRSGR